MEHPYFFTFTYDFGIDMTVGNGVAISHFYPGE